MRSFPQLMALVALACLAACGPQNGGNIADLTYRVPAVAYSPYHTDAASCPTADAFRADFARMHGLADTVRIYALRDCNQGESAMAAATALGMHVNLGLWLDTLPGDANGVQPVAAELQILSQLLDTYGPTAMSAITVGNETQRGTTVSESTVTDAIGQVRTLLASKGAQVPVTSAQVATDYTPNLLAAVDFLLPNIHPYWAGIQASAASAWVVSTAHALSLQSGKEVILGETGWPTAGDTQQDAVPSEANADTFMLAFVCDAAAAGLTYTYFEGFDVVTNASQAPAEAHWGVMDGSGALKAGVPNDIHCNSTSTK